MSADATYDPERFRLVLIGEDGFPHKKPLGVPPALALGRYEALSDRELHDHHDDIHAELERRDP